MGIKHMKINEKQLDMPNIDNKVQEMIDFENNLYQSTKEMKKMNKKKRKRTLAHTEVPLKKMKVEEIKGSKPKKKKMMNRWVETDLSPDEIPINASHTNDVSATSTKHFFNGNGCSGAETENVINSTTGKDLCAKNRSK